MHNPIPKAILLDMDDTILDFSGGAAACWDGVCGEFAHEFEDVSAQQLRRAIDDYRRWFWDDAERHRRGRLDMEVARREIVTGALLRLGLDVPEIADRIARAYITARAGSLRLFPGAVETLDHLRLLGIRLALITNGRAEDQRGKIEQFALARFFDYILIEGEYGVGKPDERVYRHALAQVGVAPAEAWMVGDNLEWDVAAPQRLGIFGIWYDVAGTGLPASSRVRPDAIVRTLAGLAEVRGGSPGLA